MLTFNCKINEYVLFIELKRGRKMKLTFKEKYSYGLGALGKELKKEWIAKKINEINNEKIIDCIYGFIKGCISSKERKIGNER